MAADVSHWVNSENSETLITRDLLGEFSKTRTKDLDLELQVNNAWVLPIDVKSGMVYQQRCNSLNSPLSSLNKKKQLNEQKTTTTHEREHSLYNSNMHFMEESYLELKLVPSSSCESVCTLDMVKSALQRAEQGSTNKKRSTPLSSTLKVKQNRDYEEEEEEDGDGNKGSMSSQTGMFAAGCPSCLLYVMTLKANPKCPRCNSTVPSPRLLKKPRIDLNTSL